MTERARDEIWDALASHFGDVRDAGARARRNAAVKRLRDAEATPEQIEISCQWCKQRLSFYTEMAVCMYLDRAVHEYMAAITPTALGRIRRMAGDDDA